MIGIAPGHIVERATRELVSETREGSSFWDQVFTVIHKVHLVWRTFEKISTYKNPDNFLQLFAGHSLNWTLGDTFFVKMAASTVMIALRILECVKEELLLLKEIDKLYDACFDNTFLCPRIPWAKPQNFTFLSPSCAQGIREAFLAFLYQTLRMIRMLFAIIKQLFILSMRMISAKEAFSLKPEVIREGTKEIFINLEKCYTALIENKELLLSFLKEHESIIEKVLEGFGGCTYKVLVENVEKAISFLHHNEDQTASSIKKYSRFAFQHIIFGIFQSVNMHHFMPYDWIPPLEVEWIKESDYPRFPPKDWVQIYQYEKINNA